jgi:DUF971 family protein
MTVPPPENSPRPYPNIRPQGIVAPHGATSFQINWVVGGRAEKHSIGHRVLRGFCPCAGCQGHSGEVRFHPGNEELREIEPVGRYALALKWGDAHATGIYSFELLWRLGELVRCHGEQGTVDLGVLPRGSYVDASNR